MNPSHKIMDSNMNYSVSSSSSSVPYKTTSIMMKKRQSSQLRGSASSTKSVPIAHPRPAKAAKVSPSVRSARVQRQVLEAPESSTMSVERLGSDQQAKLIFSDAAECKHVFKNVGIDDPLFVVSWNADNVESACAVLNAANAGLNRPAWLGAGGFPIAMSDLQGGIMRYLHHELGVGELYRDSAIGRLSVLQFSELTSLCTVLSQSLPLLSTVPAATLPLARVFAGLDRQPQSNLVRANIRAPAGAGAQAIFD